jgi:xylulokinase
VYLEAGKWALSAGMATSGALTRWFRDELAGLEYMRESEGGPNAYAVLAETAASVPPGSQGLIVLPYWSGERTPINDPLARGVIAGLTLAHTRRHLYRAVLEGVAYGAAHNLEVIHAAGAQTRRVVAVGGGTKNRLWLQIVSDVTGIEQVLPEQTIGAAFGDAFLAALGSGCFTQLDDVKAWVKETQVIQPDPVHYQTYQPYYQAYRELYPGIKAHLHRLARLGGGGDPEANANRK